MFAVLADDYTNEVQNTPHKTRTPEPAMLDRVTASNSFELTPGHVGMFLGAKHKYVIQAREHIQAETKLRLRHRVSEDGVVAFHFRGAIHKKKLLRMAYQTLFNTPASVPSRLVSASPVTLRSSSLFWANSRPTFCA